MSEPPFDWFLDSLRSALSRLAAPAAEQAAYLQQIGVAPCADELALELDEMAVLVPPFLHDGRLTTGQADAVLAVDQQLGAMSGEHNASLWTVNALRERSEWAEIRKLAVAALAQVSSGVQPEH